MRFGLEGRTKADRAAQAAALLATAAVHNGDRVGLLMVSDRLEVELAPSGGIRHLSQIVRALVATPTSSIKTRSDVGLSRVRRSVRRSPHRGAQRLRLRRADRHLAAHGEAARHDRPEDRESARGAAARRRNPLARGRGAGEVPGHRFVLPPPSCRVRADGSGAEQGIPALVHRLGRRRAHDVDRRRAVAPVGRALCAVRRGAVRHRDRSPDRPASFYRRTEPRTRAMVSGQERVCPSRRGRPDPERRPASRGLGHPTSPRPATAPDVARCNSSPTMGIPLHGW